MRRCLTVVKEITCTRTVEENGVGNGFLFLPACQKVAESSSRMKWILLVLSRTGGARMQERGEGKEGKGVTLREKERRTDIKKRWGYQKKKVTW